MSQFVARPASTIDSMAALFGTGRAPGRPRHTGQVCVLGAAPNSSLQPQNIFVVRVVSSVWISRPMTASQSCNTCSSFFTLLACLSIREFGRHGCGAVFLLERHRDAEHVLVLELGRH